MFRHVGLFLGLLVLAILGLPDPARPQPGILDCLSPEDPPVVYVHYPPEDGVEPFTKIFDLWVTPNVLEAWNQAMFHEFMNEIIDANQGGVFLPVWNYFCIRDRDDAWDQVLFKIPSGGGDTTLTQIVIKLNGRGEDDKSTTGGNVITMQIGRKDEQGIPHVLGPEAAAHDYTFVHELGHVMQSANVGPNTGKPNAHERFATAAEIVAGISPLDSVNVTFFDSSFLNHGWTPNGMFVPYMLYKFFNAYLHGHNRGVPGDVTDDLIYRWVRSTNTPELQATMAYVPPYTTLSRLGEFLEAAWSPGTDGAEQVGDLFHRAALALYVNRPDLGNGEYGFAGTANPRDAGLFERTDATHEVLHSRSIPPEFLVLDGAPAETTTYADPVDVAFKGGDCNPVKPLGWRLWGADYLVFKADPVYFAANPDTMLEVLLESTESVPDDRRLRVVNGL